MRHRNFQFLFSTFNLMANSFFRFKQFTVHQDKCAMKVGTDGVLLGAWAPVENITSILDVGTGTGLISLMLSQRSIATITAIDIDEGAVCQARENFEQSPWKERLNVLHTDFNTFQPSGLFDLIVSNPPYFVNSLKSPDAQRSIARHDNTLTYNNLFRGVSQFLAPEGIFAVIVPADVLNTIVSIAAPYNLYPYKHTDVITSPGKPPKRTLICFTASVYDCRPDELLIELERHKYSNEYIALTRDFYLKTD